MSIYFICYEHGADGVLNCQWLIDNGQLLMKNIVITIDHSQLNSRDFCFMLFGVLPENRLVVFHVHNNDVTCFE